ncbi:thymosin beta [Salmonella sp. s51228]|uniref:thymosin beta n=1 Tax=Salmonella sp. s51228 TaxID=3159652 RepID=UPI0039801B6C
MDAKHCDDKTPEFNVKAVADFDPTKLKKTETKECNTLPTKDTIAQEIECDALDKNTAGAKDAGPTS